MKNRINCIKLKTHKDLTAWQKSYALCLLIFKFVKKFPKSEEYGLSSQIKRSALSVPSNIAEGYNRHQTKEYIRFLYIAYSSLAELETQLMLAKDLNYISLDNYESTTSLLIETQKIMSGLIKSLKNRLKCSL